MDNQAIAVHSPINTLMPSTVINNCANCDVFFQTTANENEPELCNSCADFTVPILERMVNDAIDSTIAKLRAAGGNDELINKISNLTQLQKAELVEKWANR